MRLFSWAFLPREPGVFARHEVKVEDENLGEFQSFGFVHGGQADL